MSIARSNPLDELVIPDGARVEEHDLVTDGDVIVGGQSTVEFGVRGHSVIAGERVRFGGHIEAEGDCRLDMWCDVADSVLVGGNAYLGERVHIDGQLKVAGDLDIGDDVDIEDGFEANGWIVIRNPMPTIVFLFVYLSQLLRIGEEEVAEELLSDVVGEERDREPVVIPRGARVSDDTWRVSEPGRIGDGCRLHGNVRAESLVVGRDTEIFGSLRSKEGVTVGAGTQVTGNVTTRGGMVRIGPDTEVRGDVSGAYVEIHRDAAIEGSIRAREEMTIVDEPVLDDSIVSSGAVDSDEEGDQTGPADEASTAEAPAGDESTGDEPTPAIRPIGGDESTDSESADGEPADSTASSGAASDGETSNGESSSSAAENEHGGGRPEPTD